MTFRFKNNTSYEGETLFGGCGYVNRNAIYLLKRTKNYIIYRDKWGRVHRKKRMYHIKCEFFSNSFESFYADSVGEQMSIQVNDSIGKKMLKQDA